MKAIICREDTTTRKQVVFLLDTLNVENQTMGAWYCTSDTKVETVSLDYYRQTTGLKEEAEYLMAAMFIERFKENVAIRRRLYKVAPPGMKQGAYNDEHFDRGTILKKLAEIRDQVDQLTSVLKEAA